jgi:hypothetical protein
MTWTRRSLHTPTDNANVGVEIDAEYEIDPNYLHAAAADIDPQSYVIIPDELGGDGIATIGRDGHRSRQ